MARPKIDIPMSPVELALQFVGLLAFITMGVLLGIKWDGLPAEIPTHFNMAGEVDGYGGKGYLLFEPIMAVVLYAGILILSRFPHLSNYNVEITEENAHRVYAAGRLWITVINVIIAWMFAALNFVSINAAETANSALVLPIIGVFTVLLAAAIIVMMIRLKAAAGEQ